MISCEKQMQPRQSSSSGDFAIIIKMKIRIKPEVSEMMPTFRSIWIGLISPELCQLFMTLWLTPTKKKCHGLVCWCTVVDRVMKSKLSHIPHNQYYPRVHKKKGYYSSRELAIFCNQLFCQKFWWKIGVFQKF